MDLLVLETNFIPKDIVAYEFLSEETELSGEFILQYDLGSHFGKKKKPSNSSNKSIRIKEIFN